MNIAVVEKSGAFKEYHAQHPKAYLAHRFAMRKGAQREEQVGYFDPESKKITTFSLEPVRLLGSDEAFNEEGDVAKLDLSSVSVSLEDALRAANKVVSEEYSARSVTQEICILQCLDGVQLWNLTLITSGFSMINVRVDASSGEVLSHEERSVMDLGAAA